MPYVKSPATGFLFILAFSLCMFSAAYAAEKKSPYKITLTSGMHYSSGDYGQSINTDILYIPFTTKIKRGLWTAKITVPYLKITGPGTVVGDGDTTATTGTSTTKTTKEGMGDIILSLSRAFRLNDKGTFADLTGKVKLPTADEDKRLGTGVTDYIAEARLTQMYGDIYATAKIGRKFAGSSDRYSLKDSWRFSTGAGYKFNTKISAGLDYNFRESSSRNGTNHSELLGYGLYKIDDNWGLQLYASKGFTDGTADKSVGLMVNYKFDTNFR